MKTIIYGNISPNGSSLRESTPRDKSVCTPILWETDALNNQTSIELFINKSCPCADIPVFVSRRQWFPDSAPRTTQYWTCLLLENAHYIAFGYRPNMDCSIRRSCSNIIIIRTYTWTAPIRCQSIPWWSQCPTYFQSPSIKYIMHVVSPTRQYPISIPGQWYWGHSRRVSSYFRQKLPSLNIP